MKNKIFSNVKGDIFGGTTAAIIALPMAIAFGIQSGLGAIAGIFTAIILAFTAALIGGTKTLISDPTGPMTVVTASIVGITIIGDGEINVPVLIGIFCLAAVFQIILGFLRVAKYVRYMPYPVVSGFMGGIGIIIILFQLFPIMGLKSPKGTLTILLELPQSIPYVNVFALLLGIGTIISIYILPKISSKIPSILVTLVVFTLISLGLNGDIARIGNIPDIVPSWQFKHLVDLKFSDIEKMIYPALTLAALGMIDTLLTSVVADNLTQTRHNGNKEMIGQGLGNFLTVILGGIPGAGATMGTVSNINSGAKTNLSGISKGIVLFIFVLIFKDYLGLIPIPVLAGILFTVGIGVIDVKGIALLPKIPKSDALILIIVLLITVFDNLLHAVAIGVIISGIMFIKRMIDSTKSHNKTGELKDFLDKQLPEHIIKNVFVKELEGPLFFGFADDFRRHSETISENHEVVIINLTHVPFMDESGLLTLERVIRDIEATHTEVFLVGVEPHILEQLKKLNIVPDLIKPIEVFNTFEESVDYLESRFDAIVRRHQKLKLQDAVKEAQLN